MKIELPIEKGFTIYSKSNCINCDNIKKLLEDNKLEYNVINCDNYLNENKNFFLEFMKLITRQECKMFPIVFSDQKFIGGYKEGMNEIYRICFDTEDNF
jgi:glutaredoxin